MGKNHSVKKAKQITMAAIDQFIERIPNPELQEQLRIEIARLTKKKRFGLVYENHLPDNVIMPEVTLIEADHYHALQKLA